MKKHPSRRGLEKGIAPLICAGFVSSGNLFTVAAFTDLSRTPGERSEANLLFTGPEAEPRFILQGAVLRAAPKLRRDWLDKPPGELDTDASPTGSWVNPQMVAASPDIRCASEGSDGDPLDTMVPAAAPPGPPPPQKSDSPLGKAAETLANEDSNDPYAEATSVQPAGDGALMGGLAKDSSTGDSTDPTPSDTETPTSPADNAMPDNNGETPEPGLPQQVRPPQPQQPPYPLMPPVPRFRFHRPSSRRRTECRCRKIRL